eukprot:TRINITY_DN28432_c0_g1_i1.p1 TRINITY_DN28432_c0_g1~~TRINITY_DN28432_c0_g1_i1.p1  ORF type:complete len:284 (+),score=117.35 TRINITY_DN28432_c0_g1_i1:97-948(+)
MRIKDLIEGVKADGPSRAYAAANVDPMAEGASFVVQEHEALTQLTRVQNRALAAIKRGDPQEARKLRQVSKIKELNYKELCVDKAHRGGSLRKREQPVPYTEDAWPVLPRVDESLSDKHAAMRAWQPAGHRCYRSMKEYEANPPAALQDVRREVAAVEAAKKRQLKKKRQKEQGDGRARELQANIFRPADNTPVNTQHLEDLFEYLDISGDGRLDSSEVAEVITEQNAFLGAPCPKEAVSRAFRCCGGSASRWKSAARLRQHETPASMNFDEFCTVMLAQAAV